MKKTATLLLLFLYTASIAGIGVKAFYCCNKLSSISATFLVDTQPEHAKSKDQPGCCDTKYTFVKVKDNHKSSGEILAPLRPLIASPLYYIAYQPIPDLLNRNVRILHRSNAPPESCNRPSYIVNCVYRI